LRIDPYRPGCSKSIRADSDGLTHYEFAQAVFAYTLGADCVGVSLTGDGLTPHTVVADFRFALSAEDAEDGLC
jgi:hypothetical protein